jgi:membrane fusion protein, multidrug efflux system
MKLSLRRTTLLVALAALGSTIGCKEVAERQEPLRLVRVTKVGAVAPTTRLNFAGDVRARYETPLGFRVAGKILTREVEVGSMVKAGQILAKLDPTDLQLGVQALRADLSSAQSELALAEADLRRYGELRNKNFISQAEFERRSSTMHTAREKAAALQAQLSQSQNQAAYAVLAADHAGVVTAIQAEVGQVVQAGQPVVRVARLEEKEVVISVPEQKVEAVKAAREIRVALWANPEKSYPGTLREIAPSSDPATRTYAARISVPDSEGALGLGMTAQVTVPEADRTAEVRLPLSALYTKSDRASVWVVDPKTSKVSQVAVETGGVSENQVVIKSGVKPGDLVVTAGANLLVPDQQVRLAETES